MCCIGINTKLSFFYVLVSLYFYEYIHDLLVIDPCSVGYTYMGAAPQRCYGYNHGVAGAWETIADYHNYKQNMMDQIIGIEHSEPKAYWQLVEKLKKADNPIQSSSSVSLEDKNDSSENAQYLMDRISELRAEPFLFERDFWFTNDEIKSSC